MFSITVSERVVAENNALGDKDKKLPIIDIRPGWLKPGVIEVDGDVQGNGMSKASIPKVPAKQTTRFIEGVTVKDIKTGQTYSGTIDLKPTLDRIANGGTYPHRNDGTIFKNLPDRTTGKSGLPEQPVGYYKGYVHPTPNMSGPGPQRIVVGQKGESYYTSDHYQTFIKIN